MRRPRIVIAGGGTGGHIFPGLAVADALRELLPEVDVLWLGSRRGHESRLVTRHGLPIRYVAAARIVGGSPLARVWGLALIPVGVLQALWLFLTRRPAAVLGVGGYASAAGGVAARLLGVPLVIAEQNALPGRTNRKLGRFARTVAIAFEEARAYFPEGRCELTGNPVRAAVVSGSEADRENKAAASVLVFGRQPGRPLPQRKRPGPARAGGAGQRPAAPHSPPRRARPSSKSRRRATRTSASTASKPARSSTTWAAPTRTLTSSSAVRGRPRSPNCGPPADRPCSCPSPSQRTITRPPTARHSRTRGAALMVRQEAWDEAELAARLGSLFEGDTLREMGRRAAEQARPDAARAVARILRGHGGLSVGEEVA